MTAESAVAVLCAIRRDAWEFERIMRRVKCEEFYFGHAFCWQIWDWKPSRWCNPCRREAERLRLLKGYWWLVEYGEVYNGGYVV